jgi:hypothetical protein
MYNKRIFISRFAAWDLDLPPLYEGVMFEHGYYSSLEEKIKKDSLVKKKDRRFFTFKTSAF